MTKAARVAVYVRCLAPRHQQEQAWRFAAHTDVPFPASWHRAVVARIALEVPGLSIVYHDSVP